MTVDNTEQIKKLISGCGENEFYVVQILHRGKDGRTQFEPEGKKISVQTVKTYYVSSPEYLEYKMKEIRVLCEVFNARAYINLNRKSWKQINLKSLELIARDISNEDYHSLKSLVDTACGQTGACDKNSLWIVDIDTKDMDEVHRIEDCVNKCSSRYDVNAVDIIPTLHGYHIISHPFNPLEFRKLYPENLDIHKNSPTLLYFKENEGKEDNQ